MKRIFVCLMAAACLMLGGCSWLDESYVSITPHQEQRQQSHDDMISAGSYQDLMAALEQMISEGTETAVIDITQYPADAVDSGMAVAVRHAMDVYPVGAYAVEEISYEHGATGGQPALAVTIAYRHSAAEIQRIRAAQNTQEAEELIAQALEDFDAGVVILVEDFLNRDFVQLVQDYAMENPQFVMEVPQVTANVYGSSQAKVLELTFTYQNSRDSLRQMRNQVKPVFDSASLYVSGEGADHQKYAQLYAFLMERFEYTTATSITPAYSLLRHGVGDSRAFATVYAAMCRSAGLECTIVTGTHEGEPRTWNMVLDNGRYYHVDLLRSNREGAFREFTDIEMSGYVWDYSAYPRSTGPSIPEQTEAPAPTETEPAETALPEDTAPVETTAEILPEENFENF